VVLTGDIFDAWWGWSEVVPAAYVPALSAVWELVRRGTRVTWVRGNHDFHAGQFVNEQMGVAVVDVWRSSFAGRRYAAMHGDSADRSLGQRILTRALRGFGGRALMRALGPDRGLLFARGLSRGSRTHGGTVRETLLNQQRSLADAILGAQADVLFVGHSHAPGIENRPRGQLVNLGDWVEHHTFATIEDGVVCLFRWDGDRSVPLTPEEYPKERTSIPPFGALRA
jgi:UDP-2,3-diacylglucosamine hydrolase